MYRVVFAGTPDFAVGALDFLSKNHQVVAVLTQPDRPKGRGKRLLPTPVKLRALALGLKVLQPEKITLETVRSLKELKPDFLVVSAYGLILPQSLLDVPLKAPINIHPSLLPRWRGAAPIQHTILNGDKKTGVSIMKMEIGLDSGPFYTQIPFDIPLGMGAQALTNKLALIGSRALEEVINAWDDVVETPQPKGATYADKITKERTIIDWSKSSEGVVNGIKAFDLMPGARTYWNNLLVKVGSAKTSSIEGAEESEGKVIGKTSLGLLVQCGSGVCEVLTLQLPGRKMITVPEALNGAPLLAKAQFSSRKD
ncbi:MAG TPA: methionyl-tRNA formyltransferase [Gammaproteobacteria bacterium]|nr:methionyl-tRNA formyltransferase [Gammaproteobacteria bacterium]